MTEDRVLKEDSSFCIDPSHPDPEIVFSEVIEGHVYFHMRCLECKKVWIHENK